MCAKRDLRAGDVHSDLRSQEEVIRRANDTDYGLAAGIVTADLNRAHRVIHQLEAGICWINTWAIWQRCPLAANKHSGIGRENGVMTSRVTPR
ncbi:aldehyde dehydrogenase family protein [Escherichia coli]